jgi:peroxiredoxin
VQFHNFSFARSRYNLNAQPDVAKFLTGCVIQIAEFMSPMICLPVLCALTAMPLAEDGVFQFVATSVDGQPVTVAASTAKRLTVVVFLGTECPMARVYGGRLQAISDDYKASGVHVVAVMSNRQDSIQDIAEYSGKTQISFPVVRDVNNVIANAYGATRTPEVFLLSNDLSVAYHGRIDDQYQPGINRYAATQNDLRRAIEQSLAGEAVTVSETAFTGCLIGRITRTDHVVSTSLTFGREISRILQRHCVECHRPGDIGPFALTEYDEVAGWADTMLEVIANGRMPPWHADPTVGHFANARHMPQSDIDALREWVLADMPKGNDADLPPPIEVISGWNLPRPPDVVVEMSRQPFSLPSSGIVEYQYFVVDPKFTEDTWVTAAQVLPGNRAVVHHAIVFIRPPDGEVFRGVGWLTAYVPGQRVTTAPEGYARRVPAGSKFVFQMHYTPNGSPQTDLTKVGIVTADSASVSHEIFTVIGIDQEFEIPPGAPEHAVTGNVGWFPKNGSLLGYMPHMHYRGRSFDLQATTTDSHQQPLLKIPHYDFNWQHFYALVEPIDLAHVKSMSFTATFDNSPSNPFNPDPSQWVSWGDQTWEEMAVVFLEVAQPRDKHSLASVERGTRVSVEQQARNQTKIDRFVSEFFERLDSDGDGVVKRTEAPAVIREFQFWRYDRNNDLTISRDEVRALAEERFRGRVDSSTD